MDGRHTTTYSNQIRLLFLKVGLFPGTGPKLNLEYFSYYYYRTESFSPSNFLEKLITGKGSSTGSSGREWMHGVPSIVITAPQSQIQVPDRIPLWASEQRRLNEYNKSMDSPELPAFSKGSFRSLIRSSSNF